MNPAQHILIALVHVYRWTLSPLQTLLFGTQSGCRHTPTCSQYAAEAVRVHGAFAGSWLAGKRICRCHPWGTCGHDPVPPVSSKMEIPNFKSASHGS
ncbi:MAG TPA: membrane protein insertion efficiency factor YidD [Verrucomicrobiae bacterium]